MPSIHAHTGDIESDHVCNPHPVQRGPDHLCSNLFDVLWAADLDALRFQKCREVRQRILNRLSDLGLIGLIVAVNLNRKFLLSHSVPSHSGAMKLRPLRCGDHLNLLPRSCGALPCGSSCQFVGWLACSPGAVPSVVG